MGDKDTIQTQIGPQSHARAKAKSPYQTSGWTNPVPFLLAMYSKISEALAHHLLPLPDLDI